MIINQNAIAQEVLRVAELVSKAENASGGAHSPLDGGFSPVTGLSEVGAIHQRVLATDPGSARNSLEGLEDRFLGLGGTPDRARRLRITG